MRLFAIGDLHLSFATPNKEMSVFGKQWMNAADKIASHWKQEISQDDLVLLPGDISWAMKLDQALPDLAWIDALPGTKVMIRGNHDYWWPSISKLRAALPQSIHAIQNDSVTIHGISICGTRLWDSPEYEFSSLFNQPKKPLAHEDHKIFQRELLRLEKSLQSAQTETIICMTHYPPLGLEMQDSDCTKIFEAHKVKSVVFGHLHGNFSSQDLFGVKNKIHYALTSADFLDFKPLLLHEF